MSTSPNSSQQSFTLPEIPDPADSAAMGFYVVLMRVHAPLLDAIFGSPWGASLGGKTRSVWCVCPSRRARARGSARQSTAPTKGNRLHLRYVMMGGAPMRTIHIFQ